MRAILLAIAWTLAASAAAHSVDQYSEGNQRRGEEPDAPAPAVLASETSARSNKSPEGDHVLTSLEVLQLSGLLNDPIPRAQRGDIEVVEEPKPDDRGDVPGSILYGHVPGRPKRHIGSSRKLLWANKEKDTWGFGENDGLMNDQPSSNEDDQQQQHIKRPMNHHHNHHRQEDYRRGQEALRRPQEQSRRPQDQYRRPEDQYRRPEDQYRRPENQYRRPDDQYRRPEDQYRRPEDQSRRPEDQSRRPEDQSRRPEDQSKRPEDQEEQRRRHWEEQQRRRQEDEQRRAQQEEQRKAQEEERRRQWEQQRRAPENQRKDSNSQKTLAPTSAADTYEERLREWQRMKDEHDRLIRERENARKNPNHREKTEAELENELKLQEYIRRNTPINLTRASRPENLTRSKHPEHSLRPGQADNVNKSGRPEHQTRPAEDPRKDERRHRGQYGPEVRRRQEEQQPKMDEERRLREETRTRSPPVNNQQQENEQVRLTEMQRREKDEERRRPIQQQGRNVENQRNRPDIYTGHHVPSPVDERRRPEDPMSHLRPTPNPDDHQRVIRPDDPASQHHESPDQNWSAGRRNPVRVENPVPENRGNQNWWAQRPEDEARRQEVEKCRRLLEEDAQRRREEDARRRQPSRPDQPSDPVQTRPEDDDRYHQYRRNEAKVPRPPSSYMNETEEEQLRRLRGLPVGARIIVRADGSNYTYPGPAALTLRHGFGEEIDFTGFSPAKTGVVASSFPSPVTEHAPAASPPSCVWALVVCCRNPRNELKVRRCFESTNCLSWDSNKCGLDNVRAANEELMNFYVRERAKAKQPLVYQFED